MIPKPPRWAIPAAVAPALALVLLGFQLYRVHAYDLTPWTGGGLAVFPSAAGTEQRIVKVYLRIRGDDYPVELTGGFADRLRAARAEPTPAKLAALADAVLESRWRFGARLRTGPTGRGAPTIVGNGALTEQVGDRQIVIQAVRIEVWRTGYNGGERRLEGSPLLSVSRPDE